MARWKKTSPASTAPSKTAEELAGSKERMTWTIGFLTPMFGGGVFVDPDTRTRHLKKYDPVTPVRTAAIRGQLRFWWRAAIGSRLDSLQAMREREASLFGGTGSRAKVEVCIVGTQPLVKPIGADRTDKSLDYGTFPLRPERGAADKRVGELFVIEGVFQLAVRCRDLSGQDIEEVERAVETWLALGGLGGRTRRGFGALSGGRWPLDKVLAVPNGETLPGVPALPSDGTSCRRRSANSAGVAHATLLRMLKDFRQGVPTARNPGSERNRPGRSHWPEPDALRRMTGSMAPKHRDQLVHVEAFPRGLFGMPIIFHFKDAGDPDSPTLTPPPRNGASVERLASPLVLRPWKDPDQQEYCAIALVLQDPDRGELGGKISGKDRQGRALNRPVRLHLRQDEARQLRVPLPGEPDPLIAFLNFFDK